MPKKVLITVKGKQQTADGIDEVEYVTPGQLTVANGCYTLRYAETELSGMTGTTTTLQIAQERITLIREGMTTLKQSFAVGEKYESDYVTPYGTLCMGVLPSCVEIDFSERGGRIYLHYQLALDRQTIGINQLWITVKEAGQSVDSGRES